MLYLTTRTLYDTYTAARTLSEDRGPDGGFFVPVNLHRLDRQQVKALAEKSFSQNVADIVNLFFSTQLDSWAIEFSIGRYPVKLISVSSRETVAETWHNPVWKFERLAKGIEKAIRQSDNVREIPSDWLMIASRIAVLFGIFGELLKQGKVSPSEPIDVAAACGDFSGPMAVWYAKQMGLPISTVLCCCDDNNSPWRLLHKGEIRTDVPALETPTPLCDRAVPVGLERLLFAKLGIKASVTFAEACKEGSSFYLEPEQLTKLRDGLYVPVTGKERLESAIRSLYRSSGYAADVYTALCYSGILDYRSVTGESRHILILSEESPVYSAAYLSDCLEITPKKLMELLDQAR